MTDVDVSKRRDSVLLEKAVLILADLSIVVGGLGLLALLCQKSIW